MAGLPPLRIDRAPFRVSSVPATIGWRGAALQLCLCFSLQRGDPCRADLMNTLPEDLDAARQPVQLLARNLIVTRVRSEEHTSELQFTNAHLVCRLLLDKKQHNTHTHVKSKQH